MLFLMEKKTFHSWKKRKNAKEYILNTSTLLWTQPQWGWMSLLSTHRCCFSALISSQLTSNKATHPSQTNWENPGPTLQAATFSHEAFVWGRCIMTSVAVHVGLSLQRLMVEAAGQNMERWGCGVCPGQRHRPTAPCSIPIWWMALAGCLPERRMWGVGGLVRPGAQMQHCSDWKHTRRNTERHTSNIWSYHHVAGRESTREAQVCCLCLSSCVCLCVCVA